MNRAWALWVGLVVGLTGCVGSSGDNKVQGRSQVGDDPLGDPDAFATLGSKVTVGNADPIIVSGVGLVYRLAPGTGSSAPPGTWRQMLEQNLKKQGITKLGELLDTPDRTTSLVIVTAQIPAGVRKGDPIDIQVAIPDGSKTTSLKGGILLACDLMTSDTTGNITSMMKDGKPSAPDGRLLLGSPLVKAEGPVVAGSFTPAGKAADGEGASNVGRIWGGGRALESRPYYLLMNPGDQSVRMAATVAERMNATFHGTADPSFKVATFKTNQLVLVNVPPAYRHNHYRYLLVSRQVPVLPVPADSAYRRKLEEDLLDPATTIRAAIKLEALGTESKRTLRTGLESPSPWVRFAAAEALAYLGQTDGTIELAKLAEDHPAIRAQCLKALASLDDAASTDRLADLTAAADPTLRYGAFLALRLVDENNPAARGQLLNNSFWLHQVAAGTPGMVHLCTDRRAEVVVFGNGVALRGPFTLPFGTGAEFTIAMNATEPVARISRIVKVKGEPEVREVACPADLAAVVTTIARLGGSHSEAVDLIIRANRAQVLTAPLVIDAIPGELSLHQLNAWAKTDPALAKANAEAAKNWGGRPEGTAVGYDLPPEQDPDAKPGEPPVVRPPLNRDPGRIFGPKRQPDEGAEPPPNLSRNPGTLVPRKTDGN